MNRAARSVATSVVIWIVVVVACSLCAAHAEMPLERGAYLMHGLVGCGNCHTPKGPDGRALQDEELSGGMVFRSPTFDAIASNITPDRDTGIGNWTDDQIVEAIRNGKRPDSTTIGPPMPIVFYRNMADTDVRALVAYLRSVKPISHKLAKSSYKMPLPDAYGATVTHVADVSPANRIAYGLYLANIAHCMDCHTPRVHGQLETSKLGAGGQELPAFPAGVVISANLTPANPQGMAQWTDAQVETAIAAGVRPDGRKLVRTMAFDWYRTARKDDLDALVAYLRTLKPAIP